MYSKHNRTKRNGDQIVVDATTLELGINICPQFYKHPYQQHHISFVLYQMTDNSDGIAMDSHHTYYDDILEDSSEERGETGCYSYWINFNVTNVIQAWLVKEETNYGIRVECKGCSDAGISMVRETTKLQVNDAYVIKAKYMPRLWRRKAKPVQALASNKVSTRMYHNHKTPNDCKLQHGNALTPKGRRKPRCCRQRMPVNIKDMPGFEFILQPVTFDSYFCQGSCPARYNPINEHSLLQSLMHIRTKHRPKEERIPRPCCAPHKVSHLEILHLDEEDNTKLRVTRWKSVIVDECGCS